MVRLTFYGGVGEIGGNKILLEDQDTRVFLDFGVNYTERSKFYSEPWLSPRDDRGLLEFGLLPRLDGVYRFDDKPPQIDAVFLSHAHTDHSMYVSFLKRDIPIYCGETTAVIVKTFSEITRNFETNIEGLTFNTFQTGDKIKIGSLEVEPVHVDHSVPGSHGFIIHTSNGAVVYTGDFRMHGTKARMTADFTEAAARAKPLAMLCEGTNMIGADTSTEEEVKTRIGKVVAGTSQLVLANYRYSDVDRTRTLHEIAQKNERKLAISIRQAYVLKQLEQKKLDLPKIDSPEFLIFRRGKKVFFNWEKEVLNLANVIDAHEVQRIQDRVILASSFSDLKEILDIRPEPGSSFVNSSSEPFNEEQELEYGKFINWLDHFGLPMYQIHCSGHAMPNEIKELMIKIAPKRLFPIHTQYPSLYAKYVASVVRVELPQMYHPYDLV
jgi:ribonuclease J